VAGTSSGVPSAPTVAAPNFGALAAASSTAGAQNAAATEATGQQTQEKPPEEVPSQIFVEVVGYGGGESNTVPEAVAPAINQANEDEEERKKRRQQTEETSSSVPAER